MKTKMNKLLSVLLACVMLFTLLPAFANAESNEITEVFSARQFSNDAVNEFLKVFPQLASGIESTLFSTPSDSPAYVELDPNGMTLSGDLYVKMNGDYDTAVFAEFFHAHDINVYPQTLGAFLAQNGYGDIAAALTAADGWADFDAGDGPAFDFDWGLDGIDGLAERYAAFTDVIALLIDAAKPLFALSLGTQDLTLDFPGEMQFFKIVSPSIHMEYSLGITLLNKDLTDVVFYDIAGSAVFPSLGLYQTFVLPLYRALGVGTAIYYDFAAWDDTAEADALAALLYDPLYALVSAVQNDPAARGTLISFYSDGCEERVAQIGADFAQTWGDITVSDVSVDFQVNGLTSVQQNAVKEALQFLFLEFCDSGFSVDASVFADVNGYRDELNALLPALTVGQTPGIVASGYCGGEGDGTNLTWTLYDDGTLTISGTGVMADYSQTAPPPWSGYYGSYFNMRPVIVNGVESIGDHAFFGLMARRDYTLPASVGRVGQYCFGLPAYSISVEPGNPYFSSYEGSLFNKAQTQLLVPCYGGKIRIPSGVSTITDDVLVNCLSFEFSVAEDNPYYCSVNGSLYNKDVTELIHVGTPGFSLATLQADSDGTVVIPDTVTAIHKQAFSGNYHAYNVILPEGLISIGERAFSGSEIESIVIPDSVTELGEGAFSGIRDNAGNYLLSSVTIGSGITVLPKLAFSDSYALHEIVIPEGVSSVEESAFKDTALDSVYIPESVTEIGANAFSDIRDSINDNRRNISDVYYAGTSAQWENIVFGENNDALLNAEIHYHYPNAHTPGAAVTENSVSATCTAAGGYDEVVYCVNCPAELSRTHVTLEAKGHDWGEWEVIRQATREEEGLMRRVCANDPGHVQEEIIPRLEEDEEGNPSSGIIEWFHRVVDYVRGFIDWFLRLFRP